ncbi:MAG: hypothetical protein NC048_01315 [Bacteroides sp.]|nr:hypothetical protein [Ruminococcus flavefaciens]MCM1554119.1 hypothetical protein [Bacteroides sp.]
MNDKLNFLLRTILSAATEDREAFIEKFSTVLEEYTGLDKQTGANAGKHVASGLDALRQELENAAARKQASAQNGQETGEVAEELEQIKKRLDEIVQRLDTLNA